jgi:hypothetical protein
MSTTAIIKNTLQSLKAQMRSQQEECERATALLAKVNASWALLSAGAQAGLVVTSEQDFVSHQKALDQAVTALLAMQAAHRLTQTEIQALEEQLPQLD